MLKKKKRFSESRVRKSTKRLGVVVFTDKYALHAYNYCKPQSTVGLLLLAASFG